MAVIVEIAITKGNAANLAIDGTALCYANMLGFTIQVEE